MWRRVSMDGFKDRGCHRARTWEGPLGVKSLPWLTICKEMGMSVLKPQETEFSPRTWISLEEASVTQVRLYSCRHLHSSLVRPWAEKPEHHAQTSDLQDRDLMNSWGFELLNLQWFVAQWSKINTRYFLICEMRTRLSGLLWEVIYA